MSLGFWFCGCDDGLPVTTAELESAEEKVLLTTGAAEQGSEGVDEGRLLEACEMTSLASETRAPMATA